MVKIKAASSGEERRWKRVRRWALVAGLVVAVLTIGSYLTRSFVFVFYNGWSWLHRKPVIVLRSERLDEIRGEPRYSVKFSLVNQWDEAITLNSIVLHIGDYTRRSPNPEIHYFAYETFSRQIKLRFVGLPNGSPFPLLKGFKSAESMGSSEYAVVTERGSIAPHEQVDVDLVVDVSLPPELRTKYPTLWSLGGQIEARYEDESLRQDIVQYPTSRLVNF